MDKKHFYQQTFCERFIAMPWSDRLIWMITFGFCSFIFIFPFVGMGFLIFQTLTAFAGRF